MKTPLLSLQNIKTPFFQDLSLDLFEGEFVILLGSNGSGKSSLIKLINGLLSPSSGEISFQGEDLLKKPVSKRSKSIITLTQDLTLSTFSELTVLENCLMASYRHASCKKKDIRSFLASYHAALPDKLHLPVSSLSGGERQTLALALSLWEVPDLLLLDEHTSALDPCRAEQLMRLTEEVIHGKKVTTLAITHNLSDALRYGSRLLLMHQGKILLDVSNEEKKSLTREKLLAMY